MINDDAACEQLVQEEGTELQIWRREMPEISANAKVILGIISASTALVAGLVGYMLSASIVRVLSGRPTVTTKRPTMLWIVFFLTAAIALLTGSLVTFAPQVSERPLPTQEAHNIRMVMVNRPQPIIRSSIFENRETVLPMRDDS